MKVNYQISYICAIVLAVNLLKPGFCYSNGSGERLSPSLFTIITQDNGNSELRENDYMKIFLKEHDSIAEFTFNEQSPCVEVKHGNTTVWSYNNQPSKGHPKSFCLHRDLRIGFLEFKESTSIYMCNESGCEFIKHFDLEGFTPSKLKIVTESRSGSAENDPNSFSAKSFGFGTEYAFNYGVYCTEVKFDGQTVWTPSIHNSNRHPKKLFMQPYTKMLIVDFINSYSVYRLGPNGWELVSTDSLAGASESDFTLIGNSNGAELDKSAYNLIKYPYGRALLYNFTTPACTELKYKNETVWKQEQSGQFPASIYVNWDIRMLFVVSPTFINAYMHFDKHWHEIFRVSEAHIPNQHSLNATPSQTNAHLTAGKKAPKSGFKKSQKINTLNQNGELLKVICIIFGVLVSLIVSLAFIAVYLFEKEAKRALIKNHMNNTPQNQIDVF